MSEIDELYTEQLIEHGNHPRNFRKPEQATFSAHGYNPLCGDDFHVYLNVDGDRVTDAAFQGKGCAISTASASMMTEALKGLSLDEVEALFHRVRDMLTKEEDERDFEAELTGNAEALIALAGVRRYPMRVKCATLAWHTMHSALSNKTADTVTTE